MKKREADDAIAKLQERGEAMTRKKIADELGCSKQALSKAGFLCEYITKRLSEIEAEKAEREGDILEYAKRLKEANATISILRKENEKLRRSQDSVLSGNESLQNELARVETECQVLQDKYNALLQKVHEDKLARVLAKPEQHVG